MTGWRTTARRLASDDRGIGMIELLVVMLLMTVLGGIVMAGIIGGMRTTAYGQQRVEATASAQVGIERMSRELRAADPLRITESDRVAADVRRGGVLYHYVYRVEENAGERNLVEQRWTFEDAAVFDAIGFDPYAETPDATSQRVLVFGIENSGIFSYLGSSGDPLAAPVNPQSVRQVVVAVDRLVAPGRSPVQVETIVKVRNS